MVEERHSNLEPIDENDLNLKEKFLGGEAPEGKVENQEPAKEIVETAPSPEQSVERKEGEMEKDEAYSKIMSKISATSSSPRDDVVSDAEVASKEKDAESKINNLVVMAEAKGVAHAVKVARHLEDNYTLDEFHDRLLSEELHDALIKKGLIKEI